MNAQNEKESFFLGECAVFGVVIYFSFSSSISVFTRQLSVSFKLNSVENVYAHCSVLYAIIGIILDNKKRRARCSFMISRFGLKPFLIVSLSHSASVQWSIQCHSAPYKQCAQIDQIKWSIDHALSYTRLFHVQFLLLAAFCRFGLWLFCVLCLSRRFLLLISLVASLFDVMEKPKPYKRRISQFLFLSLSSLLFLLLLRLFSFCARDSFNPKVHFNEI